MLNCYFYARHKLKLVKICNISVVYITISNCASVSACDQRERADNRAIATPYRARATLGSVGESERGGSERGGSRASGVNAVSGYVKHTAFYSLSIKNFVRFGPTFL